MTLSTLNPLENALEKSIETVQGILDRGTKNALSGLGKFICIISVFGLIYLAWNHSQQKSKQKEIQPLLLKAQRELQESFKQYKEKGEWNDTWQLSQQSAFLTAQGVVNSFLWLQFDNYDKNASDAALSLFQKSVKQINPQANSL